MDVRELTVIVECHRLITLIVAQHLSLIFGTTTGMWLWLQDSYARAQSATTTSSNHASHRTGQTERISGRAYS